MIKSTNFEMGLDHDDLDLNTAEAFGFNTLSTSHENPYIIPDDEEHLSVLRKKRATIIA